jgi:hypothetical protein
VNRNIAGLHAYEKKNRARKKQVSYALRKQHKFLIEPSLLTAHSGTVYGPGWAIKTHTQCRYPMYDNWIFDFLPARAKFETIHIIFFRHVFLLKLGWNVRVKCISFSHAGAGHKCGSDRNMFSSFCRHLRFKGCARACKMSPRNRSISSTK